MQKRENSLLKKNGPIGIFDSGIGGLTVAKAITDLLPNESIIYFGDTKHLPYGEKSDVAIKHYAHKICHFLISQGCKCIVVACNTAATAAYESLAADELINVPIVDVVNPLVDEVIKLGFTEVGIIATRATIRSDRYREKLLSKNSKINVKQMATPLLVPMIEEGFYQNNISKEIIQKYLAHSSFKDVETLLLACTHYPLIKDEIQAILGNQIKVLDSTLVAALRLKEVLKKNNIEQANKNSSKHKFLVSDLTDSFKRTAAHFYRNEIDLEWNDIWKG